MRPITGLGLVNAVFEVETPSQRLVFRIQFDDPEVGEFRKEEWCMARAKGAGVPGPEVVAIGVHGAHAYAIHTFMPGVVASRYTGDTEWLWRRIGSLARRFHQVPAEGFGEHLGGPIGDSADTSLGGWVDSWDEFIFATPLLVERGVLSAVKLERARARLDGMRGWTGEPRLCHGNLLPDNILVDGDDVYILDWGTAAGHLAPLFDLAELHAWSLDPGAPHLSAFFDGYGLAPRELEDLRPAIDTLQLWRILSGMRWMLANDRLKPDSLEFAAQKLAALTT